jgi:hypothetical protein
MRKYVVFGSLALMALGSAAGSMPPPLPDAQEPAIAQVSGTVGCNFTAFMPDAPLRVDECEGLVDLYQILAVIDSGANRDGDEQMSCSDLGSELAREHGPALRLEGRFGDSIVAVARGLSEFLQADPRLGRLLQLAAAQDCTADN